MGGLGSGRRGGWGRDKVEQSRSIDVNKLQREGRLRGWGFTLQFWRNGTQIGVIHIRPEQERIFLEYRVRTAGEDWEDVVEVVGLARLPCPFGGERLYFLCPGGNGATCGRRVGKLYGAGRHFLCRRCSKLTYASQCEDTGGRLRRKARKVLRRLDGDNSDWISAQRPKGMWRRTFDRLQREAFELEMEADQLFDVRWARIESRLTKITRKHRRKIGSNQR